jgi:hypothetical protein
MIDYQQQHWEHDSVTRSELLGRKSLITRSFADGGNAAIGERRISDLRANN